ncbi:MAG: DUF2520 domain-containing protein [Chitinophagales bacterium]
MKKIQRVGFIGSGNMATHLALALNEKDIDVVFIASRSLRNAEVLAQKLGAAATNDLSIVCNFEVDLIIIAVNDQQIENVASQIKELVMPIVHTSGATPKSILSSHAAEFGVFYPLQTMTKFEAVDFSTLPICIDSNTPSFLHALENLAKLLTNKIYSVSDEQREWLHLSAVLLNNNINHLLARVNDLLADKKLPAEILQPLLKETIRKAALQHPKEIQTGPAIRNDENTKKRHLKLLEEWNDESLTNLYKAFWKSIQSY